MSRLLHPICPFVTEAIWPHIQSLPRGEVEGVLLPESELVAVSPWPDVTGIQLDSQSVQSFEQVQELITVIRAARSQQHVKPKQMIDLVASSSICALAQEESVIVSSLCGIENISTSDTASGGFAVPFQGETIFLMNMLDDSQAQERNSRLEEEIASLEERVAGLQGRLSNDSYVNNAPAEVVQETKDMLKQAEHDLDTAKDSLSS